MPTVFKMRKTKLASYILNNKSDALILRLHAILLDRANVLVLLKSKGFLSANVIFPFPDCVMAVAFT